MVLGDPGEAFLPPAPFCSGLGFISHVLVKVELILVYLGSEITDLNTHPFYLTGDKLEQALLRLGLRGERSVTSC